MHTGGNPTSRPRLGFLAFAFVLLALAALVVVPILVKRRVDAVRANVEEVADPARTLVTRLQYSLSREMSSLRGFLLTGDEQFLDRFTATVADQQRIHAAMEPYAARLGPEVLARFVETRLLSQQWHTRADADAIARRREANPTSGARIATEQALYEQAILSSNALDAAIVGAAQRGRAEIRAVEQGGLVLTGLLGVLALGAAGVVGWLHRRVSLLATEADRRRREAERALEERSRADEARVRLLRGVTHDVKNPLGAAMGYADLLEMQIKGPLTPEQLPLVEGLRRSVDGALAIINDLLDIARSDGGGLPLEWRSTDLAGIVDEVVRDHRAVVEGAGHHLRAELARDLTADTDPARVKQVLGNLLSNAIKYTPAPGSIMVRVEAVSDGASAPGPGAWATIQVLDTGPGIPPDQREMVFDEFTRLHDGTDVKGHGLGLAISRRLARMLRGELSVADAPGGGGAFVLWLPLTVPASAPGVSPAGPAA